MQVSSICELTADEVRWCSCRTLCHGQPKNAHFLDDEGDKEGQSQFHDNDCSVLREVRGEHASGR